MYEPVLRLNPVLVNNDVNKRRAASVVTKVDGGHLHNTIRIGVPAGMEPGLRAAESSGIAPAVRAGCGN